MLILSGHFLDGYCTQSSIELSLWLFLIVLQESLIKCILLLLKWNMFWFQRIHTTSDIWFMILWIGYQQGIKTFKHNGGNTIGPRWSVLLSAGSLQTLWERNLHTMAPEMPWVFFIYLFIYLFIIYFFTFVTAVVCRNSSV